MLGARIALRLGIRVNTRQSLTRIVAQSFCAGKENSQFDSVLKKVKGRYDEHGEKIASDKAEDCTIPKEKTTNEKSNEDGGAGTNDEKPPINYAEFTFNTINSGRTLMSSLITGIKETWVEMLEGNKESKVRKAVPHAQVYQKRASEGTEEEGAETPVYEGTTAIMVGKTQKTAWEQMSERLENSPLIREMLRSSRRYTKRAADTPVGQQAAKLGENVTNKIHVRQTVCLGITVMHDVDIICDVVV